MFSLIKTHFFFFFPFFYRLFYLNQRVVLNSAFEFQKRNVVVLNPEAIFFTCYFSSFIILMFNVISFRLCVRFRFSTSSFISHILWRVFRHWQIMPWWKPVSSNDVTKDFCFLGVFFSLFFFFGGGRGEEI